VLLLHQALLPVIKLGILWYIRANLHQTTEGRERENKTDLVFHKFIIDFVHLGKLIMINLEPPEYGISSFSYLKKSYHAMRLSCYMPSRHRGEEPIFNVVLEGGGWLAPHPSHNAQHFEQNIKYFFLLPSATPVFV
jgi:hypothetical protein